MARIRSIHPGIFTDDGFIEASPAARVFLIGLWCEADDNGIFEWKPKSLKVRILPADQIDTSKLLEELRMLGFLRTFSDGEKQFGAIKNFVKWQRPKKPKTVYPVSEEIGAFIAIDEREEDPATRLRRLKCESQDNKCSYCGTSITYYSKRSNSLELDHDLPVSRGGDDRDENLVATCRTCNRSKNNRTGDEFRVWLSVRNPDDRHISSYAKEKFAKSSQSPNPGFAPQREDEGGIYPSEVVEPRSLGEVIPHPRTRGQA